VIVNKRIALAFVLCAAVPSIAHAQSENQQLAQTLFDEGMKLIGEGNFSSACPKLAESQRLDPGGGTLINLAMCREKEGKLASAWAAYNEALSSSIRDGRKERENAARDRLAAIMPKLSRCTLNVSPDAANAAGFELRLDDAPVRQAAWGLATPTDIGTHALVATATGKIPWKGSFTIKSDNESRTITIPTLEDVPVVEVVQPPPSNDHTTVQPGPENTTLAWVIGSVGVAGIVTGTISGIAVLALRGQSDAGCVGGCTQQAVDSMNQAQSIAWVSDIAFAVGIAALGTSALLFVFAKPSVPQRASITPVIGPLYAGMSARF
jgi:hypothetical protein